MLLNAILNKNVEEIRKIIRESSTSELLKLNDQNENLIHLAFDEDNDAQIVKVILEEFKIKLKNDFKKMLLAADNNGWTALHYAARLDNYEVFCLIIEALGEDKYKAARTIAEGNNLPLEFLKNDEQLNEDRELIREDLEKLTFNNTNKIRDTFNEKVEVHNQSIENNLLAIRLQLSYVVASHVGKLIHWSSTRPSFNRANLTKDVLDKINDKILEIKEIYEEQCKQIHLSDANETNLERLKVIVDIITKFAVGNCLEYSYLVLYALIQMDLGCLAEIYKIKGGDHSFVVIGRDPNADLNDWTKWGEAAVVIDAWDGKVYPANKIPEELEHYICYVNPKTGKESNITVPFNPKYQSLEPDTTDVIFTKEFFLKSKGKSNGNGLQKYKFFTNSYQNELQEKLGFIELRQIKNKS